MDTPLQQPIQDTPAMDADDSSKLRLCDAGALAPGEMLRVELPGMDPILVCNFDGRYFAVEDECTHAIASLSEGRLEGNVVFCPMHGGSFDICTGKARTLPCKHPLRTFQVEEAQGAVWLMR